MRRWLAILLLMLLPLQFSWAALASYCQHEKDVTPQHIGHHEHAHEAPAVKDIVPDKSDDAGSKTTGVHADCAYCHLSSAKTFWTVEQPLPAGSSGTNASPATGPVESQLSDRIERPNWRRA